MKHFDGGYKVVGLGINEWMTTQLARQFVANLEKEFAYKIKNNQITVREAGVFSWDCECVFPEHPLQRFSLIIKGVDYYEWFEGLDLKGARKEAKRLCKEKGIWFRENTEEGTAQDYQIMCLEYARSQR